MNRKQFLKDTIDMLTAQGCYAYQSTSCRYRTKDGKKCAFGVHIPDALYNTEMEDLRAQAVLELWPDVRDTVVAKYGPILYSDQCFLNAVQRIVHDERAKTMAPMLSYDEALKEMDYQHPGMMDGCGKADGDEFDGDE